MKKDNILKIIIQTFYFFEKKRKVQLFFSLFLIIINALFELITIYVTLSLFSLITEPNKIQTNSILNFLYGSNYYDSFNQQIYYITFTFIFTILISSFLRLFNLRYSIFLAQNIGSDFCALAFKSFLTQKYEFHLSKNSAEIISSINRNIDGSITAIDSFFQLISSFIISISIFIALFNIDSTIATFSFVFITLVYLILNIYSRKVFTYNSGILFAKQPQRLKYIQEGLGAIREVILYKLQDYYTDNFDKYDRDIRKKLAENGFLMGSVRYIIEGLILLLVAALVLIIFNSNNNIYNNFAILGTFAIGSQKLLPSIQTIYRMWSNILSKKYQIIDTLNIFKQIKYLYKFKSDNRYNFKDKIKFENIKFNYLDSEEDVLNSINLEIKKGECIGLIGKSGAGKTTIIEILMTLLRPTYGKMYIDDIDIFNKENYQALINWRFSISHVPQDIYISDCSFAENIAFGVPYEKINFDKVKTAAINSQLHQFIDKQPQKYNTFVGEGGSNLSGGQRQRLAIARALYRNSQVIILDEATSSLDVNTESDILKLVNKLKGKITFLIIAHRINTLSICDRILKIKSGKIEKILLPNELNI